MPKLDKAIQAAPHRVQSPWERKEIQRLVTFLRVVGGEGVRARANTHAHTHTHLLNHIESYILNSYGYSCTLHLDKIENFNLKEEYWRIKMTQLGRKWKTKHLLGF